MGSGENPLAIDDGSTAMEAALEEQRYLIGKLMQFGKLASDDFFAWWHCHR